MKSRRQAAAPQHWSWLELLTEAATVVVVPLDDEAARDAGLLAALSGPPDTKSRARPVGRPVAGSRVAGLLPVGVVLGSALFGTSRSGGA